jgi:hypothetical protein
MFVLKELISIWKEWIAVFVLKESNTQSADLYIHHYSAMQGQYRLR